MSVYTFAGVHPIAEEIATAALSAHPTTPVRIEAGDNYDVGLTRIETSAAAVTIYATVASRRGTELTDRIRELLVEAEESRDSARKEAVRLNGPTVLHNGHASGDGDTNNDGDLNVMVRVETARIQEDLLNLRDTLNALGSAVEELIAR